MSIYTNFSVLNIHNTPAAITDEFSNRPAADINVVAIGTIFIATDTQEIYTFNGGEWILIGSGTGGGGIPGIDSVLSIGQSLTTARTIDQANKSLLFDNVRSLQMNDHTGTPAFKVQDDQQVFLGDYSYIVNGTSLIVDPFPTSEQIYTNYQGNGLGMELNFGNNFYSFGDFNGTFSGTYLKIDVLNTFITTYNGNNRRGLSFNFDENDFAFGDFDNIYTGGSFFILNSSSIIKSVWEGHDVGIKLDFQNFVYLLGDFDQINNGTYFKIDDTELNYQFYNNGVSNGLYVDFNKKWYKFGDYNNQYNNSHFYIDDPNSKITWFSKQKPYFDDLGTGAMLSNTSMGNSGQHLVINVNGTTYKIQLLNP